MFINILYYWIYMETRTKYGFGSFKNLDQGEYEITEIKTKPAEVQAFCYYQTSLRFAPFPRSKAYDHGFFSWNHSLW